VADGRRRTRSVSAVAAVRDFFFLHHLGFVVVAEAAHVGGGEQEAAGQHGAARAPRRPARPARGGLQPQLPVRFHFWS